MGRLIRNVQKYLKTIHRPLHLFCWSSESSKPGRNRMHSLEFKSTRKRLAMSFLHNVGCDLKGGRMGGICRNPIWRDRDFYEVLYLLEPPTLQPPVRLSMRSRRWQPTCLPYRDRYLNFSRRTLRVRPHLDPKPQRRSPRSSEAAHTPSLPFQICCLRRFRV